MPIETNGGADRPSGVTYRRMDAFCESLERLRGHGVDAYDNAHNDCLSSLLQTDNELRDVFGEFVEGYRKVKPHIIAIRAVKSSQALEMPADPSFPEGRDAPEAWIPTFARIVEDLDYRERYFMNLRLPIASNISERGKLLKVALQLHGKESDPSVLDIGCSLNHILIRLALLPDSSLTYESTAVLSRKPHRSEEVVDQNASESLSQLINGMEVNLGQSLGIDLMDAYRDPVFRNWARSNSFYMSELLDNEKTKQFDKLSTARPHQVGFRWADAAHHYDDLDDKFDAVYLSTSLYQMGEEERELALNNALAYIKDDGLVVVQDFVEFKPDGSQTFYEKWDWLWNYGMWVFDKSRPHLGFQKYFTVESGRAQKVIVEPALGKLALSRGVVLGVSSLS